MANHLPNGIRSLLERVRVRMMNSAQKLGNALGGDEVGTVFETDGEGMELWEGGGTAGDVACADGGYETGVESAGEEDSPGYVGHHAADYGLFKGVTEDILGRERKEKNGE